MADWSLLTNHGRLLPAIENEPGLRVRDMADRLELAERSGHSTEGDPVTRPRKIAPVE